MRLQLPAAVNMIIDVLQKNQPGFLLYCISIMLDLQWVAVSGIRC